MDFFDVQPKKSVISQGLERKRQEAKLKNLGQNRAAEAQINAAMPVAEEEDDIAPQLPSAEMIRSISTFLSMFLFKYNRDALQFA